MRTAFVSCVKTKLDRSAPAKDLYVSPWFTMARRYAETHAERWYILSAAHGLVEPEKVIDPYDISLNWMKVNDRREWSKLVQKQMDLKWVRGGTAILLAGLNYRRHLEKGLLDRFAEVEVPMSGLRLGQQLSWLSKSLQ
jgi:hypothetical protein